MNWRFRTDPANVEEKERWFTSEPSAGWCDICTDRDWTSQGHEYHGAAWYRVEFECPEALAGKQAVLRFEAVDGICHIWLDDRPIGSQLEPPKVMWNRSFIIDLGALSSGRIHRLAVHVAKENHNAGIWKAVGLIEGSFPACER